MAPTSMRMSASAAGRASPARLVYRFDFERRRAGAASPPALIQIVRPALLVPFPSYLPGCMPAAKEKTMKPYPHHYSVEATAGPSASVELSAAGLPTLASAPPVEFDGPGDLWSPETLLMAALADCFVLTFRAVARASRLDWSHLACHAEGTLERVEGVTRFTGYRIEARLDLPAGGNAETGKRLLEKAEKTCLVTKSLAAPVELVSEVRST